jgi:hypothetical protein
MSVADATASRLATTSPQGATGTPLDGSGSRLDRRPRVGWHAYRPVAGAPMPSWAVEFALTVERPLTQEGAIEPPRALLLARASAPWQPVACALGAAIRELDSIAGVGPPLPRLGLVRSHPEPGLDPIPRRVVMAHLRAASERGQLVRFRRRQDHQAGAVVAWQPGAGVVLTCTGRVGVSAQAVVAIAGQGALSALRPPPGGAMVLRGWRCHQGRKARGRFTEPGREWAFVAGIVLASPSAIGLGRVARRYAALASEAGWSATALTGAAALELVRAGDPRYPPPRTGARHGSRESITALLTTCLTAAADRTGHLALPSP